MELSRTVFERISDFLNTSDPKKQSEHNRSEAEGRGRDACGEKIELSSIPNKRCDEKNDVDRLRAFHVSGNSNQASAGQGG